MGGRKGKVKAPVFVREWNQREGKSGHPRGLSGLDPMDPK